MQMHRICYRISLSLNVVCCLFEIKAPLGSALTPTMPVDKRIWYFPVWHHHHHHHWLVAATYTPVSMIHSLLKFVEFSSNILKMYTIQMISAWGQSNLLNDLIEVFFRYDLIKCKNNHNHNQNYVMSQHWAGLIFFSSNRFAAQKTKPPQFWLGKFQAIPFPFALCTNENEKAPNLEFDPISKTILAKMLSKEEQIVPVHNAVNYLWMFLAHIKRRTQITKWSHNNACMLIGSSEKKKMLGNRCMCMRSV